MVLLAVVRAAQEELGRRVDRRGVDGGNSERIVVDLSRFATSLKTAWRDGEQRPIHRRPYRRRKPVPRRAQMLDEHAAQVRAWLEAQPGLSAQAVLARLIEAAPTRFNDKQLRTIQRAVKAWRGQMAHKLILESVTTLLDRATAPHSLRPS